MNQVSENDDSVLGKYSESFLGVTISCADTPKNRELLRIPLLKDVFQRYPTTPINIDIKEDNDELIRQVIRTFFK